MNQRPERFFAEAGIVGKRLALSISLTEELFDMPF
jgi:hypothetical protein